MDNHKNEMVYGPKILAKAKDLGGKKTFCRLQHTCVRQTNLRTSLIFQQRLHNEAKIFLLSACQIKKLRTHWLIMFELYKQPQDSYVMASQLIQKRHSHFGLFTYGIMVCMWSTPMENLQEVYFG